MLNTEKWGSGRKSSVVIFVIFNQSSNLYTGICKVPCFPVIKFKGIEGFNYTAVCKQGIHRHQTPPQYRNASPYGPLHPNVTSSIKPEVINVSQRCPRRTEPQPRGTCTKNFVKIGRAVPEMCSWTDRHTDRQTDRNTPLPCRGGVIILFNAQKSTRKLHTVDYVQAMCQLCSTCS